MVVCDIGSDRAEHITVCWALNMANLAVSECRNLIECRMMPGAEYLHKSLSHHDTETFKHFQYHIPGDTKPACFEYSWLEVRGLGIWKIKEYIKTRQDKRQDPPAPFTWSSPHVAGRGAPWDHSPHQEADTDPGHPCGDKWSLHRHQRHQGHYTHHVQRLECWQERYDGGSHPDWGLVDWWWQGRGSGWHRDYSRSSSASHGIVSAGRIIPE